MKTTNWQRHYGSDVTPTGEESDPYLSLSEVLEMAYNRAAKGKGMERHASGESFEQQPICNELRALRSITPALFQARKKILESERLPVDMAVDELLDAINYLAAAVIVKKEGA